MTAVDFVVSPPPERQAYTFENLRSQAGQEVGALVEDEGVERATLLAVDPTSGGGAWMCA